MHTVSVSGSPFHAPDTPGVRLTDSPNANTVNVAKIHRLSRSLPPPEHPVQFGCRCGPCVRPEPRRPGREPAFLRRDARVARPRGRALRRRTPGPRPDPASRAARGALMTRRLGTIPASPQATATVAARPDPLAARRGPRDPGSCAKIVDLGGSPILGRSGNWDVCPDPPTPLPSPPAPDRMGHRTEEGSSNGSRRGSASTETLADSRIRETATPRSPLDDSTRAPEP